MRKISLIGAGQIGSQLALFAAQKNLAEQIVLYDIKEGFAHGKSLDVGQCLAVNGNSTQLTGTSDIAQIAKSDVIIITAGLPRKDGMSREDLIGINAKIVKGIAENIAEHSPGSFIIVITNPLDIMTLFMLKYGKFRKNMVVGMAGELDLNRFKFFLAQKLKLCASSIQTIVLGSHSNEMYPMIRYTSIGGIPLQDFIDSGIISQSEVEELMDRTRNGGAEIVKTMGGSAYSAPAASAIKMAESYIRDQSVVLPACTYLDGEYGFSGICGGVPVKINRNGVEILKLKLQPVEESKLQESINKIKEIVDNYSGE